MPSKPKADRPLCDVLGCGMLAVGCSDGTEIDEQGRKALPNINVCGIHPNWPHSEDAARFAATDLYKARK